MNPAAPVKARIAQLLTPLEISALQQRSDGQAALALGITWGIIAASLLFAGVMHAWWSALVAVILIGARQMALAVLMHECAHRSLFRTTSLNNAIGQWLVAAPMNIPMAAYRTVHLGHHRHGGTAHDPDLVLIRGYPATPGSLLRKFLRDSCGITGVKDLMAQVRRFDLARDYRFLVVHAGLLAVLLLAGIGWTYLLWWVAYLTMYQVVLRLRLIGEHGTAMDRADFDPRGHTTTVPAGLLQRLLIAPHGVSYHVEHHFMPSVPIYRLTELHQLMRLRGYFAAHDCLRANYAQVIARALSRQGHSHVSPAGQTGSGQWGR